MKKRFFAPILFVATALFLTGCKVTEVVEFDQDIDVTIQGVTYDADGNTQLSDVAVSLVGDEAITSGEDGVYQFVKKQAGNHLLRFEKEGFATMVQDLSIEVAEVTAEELTHSSIVEMFHVGESITTTFSTDNGAETTLLPNLPVTIELDRSADLGAPYFENDKIETTTDENGAISLEGLPDVAFTISAELVDGSDVYEVSSFVASPLAIETNYTLDKTSTLSDFVLIQSNVIDDETGEGAEEYIETEALTFEFSRELNADYEDMEVTFIKTSNNRVVLVETTIEGNVLTIDPEGESLERGEEYSILIKVQDSLSDKVYNETHVFTTTGTEDKTVGTVVGIKLDAIHGGAGAINRIDRSFTIEFFEPSSGGNILAPSGYEVYAVYSEGTDEFVRLANVTQSNDATDMRLVELIINITNEDIFLEDNNIAVDPINDPEILAGYFEEGTITLKVRAFNDETGTIIYGDFDTEPKTIGIDDTE